MDEEFYDILNFLPLFYDSPSEKEYIDFLMSSFESNYDSEKYQFAFLSYHLLFMSSIYFKILQLRKFENKDFQKVLIGCNKNIENTFLNATSAFTFSEMKERSIFRFFKLIGCTDSEIGRFGKLVDDRNNVAHPNGNIFYSDKISLKKKIDEVNSALDIIQTKYDKLIIPIFEEYLKLNFNSEKWEINDFTEQINLVLIKNNYFSQKDFDFCINYNINNLKNHKFFFNIQNYFWQIKSKFTNGILEDLEGKYHKYDTQKKSYKQYDLSNEEKYSIIYYFLDNKDFCGYFQLLCDIAFEISDDSDKFIKLLSDFYKKVRNDMAQKPFMDLLVNLGSKKFALSLYNKILNNTKLDDNLRIIAGLILGGLNSETELKQKLKEEISYPQTNSYLKAILVYYEKKVLDQSIYKYFDSILKSQNINIIQELAFLSYRFYLKDKDYFYNKIKTMAKLNNQNVNWIIYSRLSYDNKFSKDQFFELVDIIKDSDIKIVDEAIQAFREYPKEHKKIVDLFIYWMNKFDKFEFDSRNFRWILEDLVKQNKFYIKEFCDRYKEIQPDKKIYLFTFPHLFEILSKYHQDYALEQIFKIKFKDEDDEHIFFDLCKKLIGNIYSDAKFLHVALNLNTKLISLIQRRPFISFKKTTYEKKVNQIKPSEISKDNYNYLIDIANNLLNKLQNRKQEYDFSLIRQNISKYKVVENLTSKLIDNLESNKEFSPLMWLGETEDPKFDDVKIEKNEDKLSKAMKISYVRSQFWSRAYLKELNEALNKYTKLPNEKFKDIKKRIESDFSDENSFWSFESELIFMNKFSEKSILTLEPKVPNRPEKNLDLKVKLFKKDIYFEIKRPEMDRNLTLNNGAVAMPNKALQSIEHKFKQMMAQKTLQEMNDKKRKDLFFIVIDTSDSTIDDYQIINAFYGSLSLTLVMDKKQGKVINQFPSRKDDSIHKLNKNTEIISGVIYFKQELMFDKENQPFIKLKGDIIQNPKGVNTLSETELIELKKIIFE